MQQSLFKLADGINILPFDGEALFYPDFLTNQECEAYYQHIFYSFTWKQEQIRMYDKDVLQPRLTAFCGEPFLDLRYSNHIVKPQHWTDKILELKQKTEAVAGAKFTNALFNLYRDGKDSVSWHRDNERYLGFDPVIASISLGTTRTFQLRNYSDKTITRSVELTSGSLLIMKGPIQRCWEHQVPKVNKRIGPRINITFRTLK
ncbi:MAG TPA: alpha-ketoglutarate-dependent dioxygenase AlkB [Bacteroidales bacterium]